MTTTLSRVQAKEVLFDTRTGQPTVRGLRLLNDIVARLGGESANTNSELSAAVVAATAAAAAAQTTANTAQTTATTAQADIDATQLAVFVTTSANATIPNARVLSTGTNTTIDTGTANVVKVNVTTFVGLTQPVYAYKIGLVNATENILRVRIPVACSLAASLAGSYGDARVAFTAAKVIDIQKNGASVGTASFGAGGTVATMAGAGASFAAGDLLAVIGPAVMDVTGADVGITLLFTRT